MLEFIHFRNTGSNKFLYKLEYIRITNKLNKLLQSFVLKNLAYAIIILHIDIERRCR